ncbi:MerR family transcriptional regulator [Phytomonospora sp. NPDC050363]|uniref:MerR family transcriptional regulator n=1 Tax=Phytomonospora sp. NPDC050363 TaxID=3155642 RepID=UPI0033F20A3F
MSAPEPLTIGRFAHLSGLTVHTLRHYHDVGLLIPADVAPDTGYRRYHREQIALARLIASLRWIDLPIDRIRALIAPGADLEAVAAILRDHHATLERRRRLTADRLRDTEHLLERGITMPTPPPRVRPAQLKLTVTDAGKAADFYRDAFGMRHEIVRRVEEQEIYSLVLGEYGRADSFLVTLIPTGCDDADRPGGTSTFGLLVDDLDAAHRQALDSGGAEFVAPHDPEGMPRCSAVGDPDGNWVWLYQG